MGNQKLEEKEQKIHDVIISPLEIIKNAQGDVLHGIKKSDQGYFGFGEAYFSIVLPKVIKGWKRHMEMVLNLIVPIGSIRFVIYDDRESSKTFDCFQEVVLSRRNYCRLTIPPMLWVAFQGLENEDNILLNFANLPHDQKEVDKKDLYNFRFIW